MIKTNKMVIVNPYLNFKGKSEEAFNFYKSVFGGEFAMLQRFRDTPAAANTPPADLDKIMHIALPIGKGNVLMATDVTGPMEKDFKEGTNISLSIHAGSKEEADKLFKGLSAGAKVDMPLELQFWGAYWGMLTDKFGIQWMVSYDPKFAD